MYKTSKATQQVNIRMNDEDRLKLQTIASKMQRTESDTIRQLIRQYVEKNLELNQEQTLPGV